MYSRYHKREKIVFVEEGGKSSLFVALVGSKHHCVRLRGIFIEIKGVGRLSVCPGCRRPHIS